MKTRKIFGQEAALMHILVQKYFLYFLLFFLLLLIFSYYTQIYDYIYHIIMPRQYQYGQMVAIEGHISQQLGNGNYVLEDMDGYDYDVYSTTIDISDYIAYTGINVVGKITQYRGNKYLINISKMSSLDFLKQKSKKQYFNEKLGFIIDIEPRSQYDVYKTGDNIFVYLKGEKVIRIKNCDETCKQKDDFQSFANIHGIKFYRISDGRFFENTNTQGSWKITSMGDQHIFNFSKYINFMSQRFVYDYIYKNFSNICHTTGDVLVNISNFNYKIQNNNRFVVLRGTTKNRWDATCQIVIYENDHNMQFKLINMYQNK